jgi:hypothetical protein
LNIYQEGDFFKPHRDTPLSKDSLGSLVIALPVAHRGGELVVTHRDEAETFDFAQDMCPIRGYFYGQDTEAYLSQGKYEVKRILSYSSSWGETQAEVKVREESKKRLDQIKVLCGKPLSLISYAAFYGDCVHEIKPVTAGMRLTLSYQLVRGSEGGSEVQESKSSSAAETVPTTTTATAAESSSSVAPTVAPAAPTTSSESKTETPTILSPAETEEILNKFKVDDLKSLCSQVSLPVSGTKAVLIQRLIASNKVKFHRKTGSGMYTCLIFTMPF